MVRRNRKYGQLLGTQPILHLLLQTPTVALLWSSQFVRKWSHIYWPSLTSGWQCSQSPFWWLIGNDVSGQYFSHYFPIFSLCCLFFSWKESSNDKNLFDGSAQKPRSTSISRPWGHFGTFWWPFWISQAVLEGITFINNFFVLFWAAVLSETQMTFADRFYFHVDCKTPYP